VIKLRYHLLRYDSNHSSDVAQGENPHSNLQVSIYDRSLEDQGFLGQLEIKPKLVHGFSLDEWFELKPRDDEKVGGDVRVSLRYEKLEVGF
jgi:serine/threonine protein kinase SCH9